MYRSLLEPRHRPGLRHLRGAGPEPVVAIGAERRGRPVAILLAQVSDSGSQARIDVVAGEAGPGSPELEGLLDALAAEIAAGGGTQIIAYPVEDGVPEGRALEAHGYQRRELCAFVGDWHGFEKSRWFRIPMPRAYEVVEWPSLREEERQWVLGTQRRVPGYPDRPIEPRNSLGLRFEGVVVGWLLVHRESPAVMRYEALNVIDPHRATGVALALLAEGARLQWRRTPEVRWVVQETDRRNRLQLRMIDRYLVPELHAFRAWLTVEYVKLLAPPAPGLEPWLEVPEQEAPPEAKKMLWTLTHSSRSPHQRIDVKWDRLGFYLELNGLLQFHSVDEHRYHEALVHPPMLTRDAPARVLILGGGDGLALREVLRHASVTQVTLVDIDSEVTDLARQLQPLAELNAHSFDDPRVELVNADAREWLRHPAGEPFDVALIDFPNPTREPLQQLYTTDMFESLRSRLSPEATISIQATSLMSTPEAFWCIAATLEAAGFHVRPYQMVSLTFGQWGFCLASPAPFEPPRRCPLELRFLDDAVLASLFVLGRDQGPQGERPNTSAKLEIAEYYALSRHGRGER